MKRIRLSGIGNTAQLIFSLLIFYVLCSFTGSRDCKDSSGSVEFTGKFAPGEGFVRVCRPAVFT